MKTPGFQAIARFHRIRLTGGDGTHALGAWHLAGSWAKPTKESGRPEPEDNGLAGNTGLHHQAVARLPVAEGTRPGKVQRMWSLTKCKVLGRLGVYTSMRPDVRPGGAGGRPKGASDSVVPASSPPKEGQTCHETPEPSPSRGGWSR